VQTFTDEEDFYSALGLEYIPPELRQGAGEIEAAQARRLPRLISIDEIRGDLHVHSDWSDGAVGIEEMVLAARDRGYEYVAITDHSGGIGVAHGLNVDRLMEEISQVRRLNDEVEGITVLIGSEVEIKSDGILDFSDEILAQLDWVIASVHSGFNQSEEQITRRIVQAIENPHVDAIGHPTGALIGKRAPYAVDLEAVFRAAARTGTALEINASPQRLDLADTQVRRAIELGVMIVINTDAHAPIHLDFMRYGVEMARRGWAESANVLNSRSLVELREWLRSASPSL
jgi:DNA polymerase (family 10)